MRKKRREGGNGKKESRARRKKRSLIKEKEEQLPNFEKKERNEVKQSLSDISPRMPWYINPDVWFEEKMRYIVHLTRLHPPPPRIISTSLLTLVMMFKNARPSITCRTFLVYQQVYFRKKKKRTYVVVIIIDCCSQFLFFPTFYFYRAWRRPTTHARLTD